jgi:L-alanine-DL-glutamate epimerase-like enolase superfamily enzyme
MIITKIEAISFHLPFDPDLHLKFAYRTSSGADHVLVRVSTNEGLTGIAEAPARPEIYGETQASIVAIIDKYFGPYIKGKNPFELEDIHSKLDHIPYNYCAKAAIDIAIHDIIGKALNVPVYQLLGGKSRDSIPLSWMVSMNSTKKMVEECQRFWEMGIKGFKIKTGLDFTDDLEKFRAIRQTLGKNAILYIDANQGYKSIKNAIKFIQKLEEDGLAYVEEPFPVENKRGRLEASRAISVPMMGDESCFTPADVARELALGAIGIVLVKIARTGFYKTKKILYLCQEEGIPCIIGSQGDSSIGAAASAHAAVAFQNILFPAEISYHLRMKGELLKSPLTISKGELVVPVGPGLGVEIDEEALAIFRV